MSINFLTEAIMPNIQLLEKTLPAAPLRIAALESSGV